MSRLAILALPLFLAACAASRTNAVLVSDSTDVRASSTSVVPTPEARATVAPSAALLEPMPATAPAPLALAPAEESLHGSRFTVKGGYYGSAIALGLEAKYYTSEDIDDFDANLDAFAVMLTLGFSR